MNNDEESQAGTKRKLDGDGDGSKPPKLPMLSRIRQSDGEDTHRPIVPEAPDDLTSRDCPIDTDYGAFALLYSCLHCTMLWQRCTTIVR